MRISDWSSDVCSSDLGIYVLAQNDHGLVLIDAHAGHERVLYEKLKRQLADGGIPAQALLVPEVLSLAEDEAAALDAQREHLRRYGFEFDRSGPASILVCSVPPLLACGDAGALLRHSATARRAGKERARKV